jgi:UDP-glucuronate 4-epimerase
MKYLVTGAAGFIGFHVVQSLLEKREEVVGLDSINSYYSLELKFARLAASGIARDKIAPGVLVRSQKQTNYRFIQQDLVDKESLLRLFETEKFDIVIHLAAQAGVRNSILHPEDYLHSNFTGFLNLLEACRYYPVKHFVFASSSSVYGSNAKMPFATSDAVDHPISLYAASKKSNELMAHSYSHLFGIPTTGLRFFTVYGPWGRPDMAYFLFADAISKGVPIQVFNQGQMKRDFTYIDDIVSGVLLVADRPATSNPSYDPEHPDPSSSTAPYKLYNIGNSSPVPLLEFIEAIETGLGKKAKMEFLPIQPGDVVETYADISELVQDMGYEPKISVAQGVAEFTNWYVNFYQS